MEEIDSACQDAVNGVPSRRPIIEMTIPSVLDKTIAPPGTTTSFYQSHVPTMMYNEEIVI